MGGTPLSTWPGQGGLPAGVPSPVSLVPLTCSVGSRVARWESWSLKALSFSSYWLGVGGVGGRQSHLPGECCSPPRSGDLRSQKFHLPTTFVHPSPSPVPCILSHPALLTQRSRSPGWGRVCPGPGSEVGEAYRAKAQGWKPHHHSPLHSLQQQHFLLCQFVLRGTASF